MKVLITGGAGFIGSNFVRYWMQNYPGDTVVNFDKLTYAGHKSSLKDIESHPNYEFIQGDIANLDEVDVVMKGVDLVVHFAAESHVDRSVIDPVVFVRTNTLGTANLLFLALKNNIARFHHVSTDEVYGSLGPNDPPFSPDTPFRPRTPYAASKAGADHLVRAFFETYGLKVTITNCANNYGPYHDPEKLIPRFITNLLEGKKVPLMGKGENIREWLYVEDHVRAIDLVIKKGEIGKTYLVQGEEKSNIQVTRRLLEILNLDDSMIEYAEDRLGHDFRYANDGSEIKKLGWKAEHTFDEWVEKIVTWYKQNEWWWKPLKEGRPVVDRVAQEAMLQK